MPYVTLGNFGMGSVFDVVTQAASAAAVRPPVAFPAIIQAAAITAAQQIAAQRAQQGLVTWIGGFPAVIAGEAVPSKVGPTAAMPDPFWPTPIPQAPAPPLPAPPFASTPVQGRNERWNFRGRKPFNARTQVAWR